MEPRRQWPAPGPHRRAGFGAQSSCSSFVAPLRHEDHTTQQTLAHHMSVSGQAGRGRAVLAASSDHNAKRPQPTARVPQERHPSRNVQDASWKRGTQDRRQGLSHAEGNFTVSDSRASQRHASGLTIGATGWSAGLKPESRDYTIAWMLSNLSDIVRYMRSHGLLSADFDHNATPTAFWYNVLPCDPITILSGDIWSGMTLLTFRV